MENAFEFMSDNGLMIVPLLSGGGMRVKIIEGMALGKTIVTTSIGAEGVDAVNNESIIIADTEEAFAEAIHKCLTNNAFYLTVGKKAKEVALKNYNNADICKRLNVFYQKLISE